MVDKEEGINRLKGLRGATSSSSSMTGYEICTTRPERENSKRCNTTTICSCEQFRSGVAHMSLPLWTFLQKFCYPAVLTLTVL